MKKILIAISLLGLVGCSSTSNDLTSELKETKQQLEVQVKKNKQTLEELTLVKDNLAKANAKLDELEKAFNMAKLDLEVANKKAKIAEEKMQVLSQEKQRIVNQIQSLGKVADTLQGVKGDVNSAITEIKKVK